MNYGMTEQELDMLVTDTEAAITLGVIDQIGKVTYREALEQFRKRFPTWQDLIDEIFNIELKK